MSKNNDFFEQNARFNGLIKHYARKIGDKESEHDLWSFLWILQNTSFVVLPDRYIAVCLRNKYYDILRAKRKSAFLPLNENEPCEEFDLDKKMDLKTAFARLETEEQTLLYQHFFEGKTYAEMAEKDGTTRQAKSQKARRVLTKMRGFF